jgi:hypothetical protein
MVSTYRTVFPNKPLCFTELGYLSPDGLGTLPPGMEWGQNTSAQEQAQWLAQAATLSRDGGVVRLMVVWNVNAHFVPSNPLAGFAIVRTNAQCLPCTTLAAAMAPGPNAAPTLVSPANGSLLNNAAPQFQWNAVDGAETYRIEIDNNSNFSSVDRASNQAGTTYTPSPALGNARYYWRVRAINNEGSGPWSAVRNVVVDTQPPPVPILLSPDSATSITNITPTFTWEASADATRYEIRITGMNPPSTTNGSGNQASFKPSAPLFIGNYTWSVRARDAAGNFSAWSAPFNLTIISPNNAAPALNYYTSPAVTLGWARVSGATQYEIQVSNSTNFVNDLAQETSVGGGTLNVSISGLPNSIYYWRVRARRNGTWSPWSPAIAFRVGAP